MRAIARVAVIFVLGLAWMPAAQAEDMVLSSAINKAGRQRMLTQRMVRAYCQIGLNVRREEARQQLNVAVQTFDAQIVELRRFAPTQEISQELALVESEWRRFRPLVLKSYSRQDARGLMELSEELLERSHKVVMSLQDLSGKPSARLVSLAGRQRMLSQRIAKLYMCRQAGLSDSAVVDALDRVRSEFKGALAELRDAPQNTAPIDRGLETAATQWALLEHSLTNADQPLEEFVALTSDKILNAMDEVTSLYEVILQP